MAQQIFVQAALNGDRVHPAAPRTAQQIAAEARAAVDAGAVSLHIHPYGDDGQETLDSGACARTLQAVRKLCPGTPISLSNSEGIEPDPARRLRAILDWTDLPELVTVNQGEAGIVELCELLLSRGVALEAGLLCLDDARRFIAVGLAARSHRVLIEPLDADIDDAVAHAEAMESVILQARISLQQVHHGDGIASWAVNRRAVALGYGIRTGLEDTPVLENGRLASGNGELVAEAVSIVAEHGLNVPETTRAQGSHAPMSCTDERNDSDG